MKTLIQSYILLQLFLCVWSLGTLGSFLITNNNYVYSQVISNYLYAKSYVSFQVVCDTQSPSLKVQPMWILKEVECMTDMYNIKAESKVMTLFSEAKKLQEAPAFSQEEINEVIANHSKTSFKHVTFQLNTQQEFVCSSGHIITLQDESTAQYYFGLISQEKEGERFFWIIEKDTNLPNESSLSHVVTRTWADGMYHLMVLVAPFQVNSTVIPAFTANVHVTLKGMHGYLPAIDWPLLPYSGVMSVMYLLLGSVWIGLWVRTALHIEKVHLFIGAVAVAGAMTNTMMFVNMTSLNSNGHGVPGLDWLSRLSASLQSCLTSALLMVVSTGYGITRPTLHRNLVVAIAVFTTLAVLAREAVVVVQDETLKIKYSYPVADMIVSGLYALTVLAIAAFIMIFSIMTFQHLRLRKHTQNNLLFCMFMVTCIIGFVVEVAMVATTYGWLSSCRTNWKWEWLFANFGSVETLALLTVLMWLWRPIDRAQSYAFYPLASEEVGGSGSEEEAEEADTVCDDVSSGAKTTNENSSMLTSTL